MADPLRPTLMARLRASFGGEQDARVLEALRQAGGVAYQEWMLAERLRDQLSADGATVWTAPAAANSQILAAWSAMVLQTLGETILDSAYAANPGTVGYVPPVTFNQAWHWLSAVDGWTIRAREARNNPRYDISAELALPAPLTVGPVMRGCPQEHREAMLHAAESIRHHAELALFTLQEHAPPQAQPAVDGVQQLAALAAAGADYVTGLRAGYDDERLHDLIDHKTRSTVALWFHIGQLAAMPKLLAGYHAPRSALLLDPGLLPGGARFDPWCLTDPISLPRWRADAAAVQAIERLWRSDPNPAATLAIKMDIDRALAAGRIVHHRTPRGWTCYYSCPWSALYEVRHPVRIGVRDLRVLDQFTYDVGPGRVHGRPHFRRAIVTGPFTPARPDGSAPRR
ncbi:hypothetical protein [Phytohabitans rumicis]|uniref:Uncharacterized protein n=1 Tax=Phytohabitans rumicis TaxID=1076125 RepID=A0A6V8L132_9ACTN|nr:hypothetical protein [Phytohabitans rumicis]GFJ88511.1 hypothetical protein Prum_021530 [Phytohabitans rumicis]